MHFYSCCDLNKKAAKSAKFYIMFTFRNNIYYIITTMTIIKLSNL